MTDDERAAYLEASCKASGVPVRLADEVTLRRIANRLIAAAVARKTAQQPKDAA